MIKKTFLILSLVFMGSAVCLADGLVAIVNNDVVTQKDLDDFINFMQMQMSDQYSEQEVEGKINEMLPDLISRLIEDRLILQAAYKEEIIIEPMRIKARMEQIKKRYPSESDFAVDIKARGMSLADVELKIKEQLLMREIIDIKIRSKLVVKPQEVTDYYEAHKQDFLTPEQRWVRVMAIKESDSIQQAQETIKKYSDLESISRVYASEINDLGWVVSDQLKKQIADIIFNLDTGSLWPYLDSENGGLYIFEVKSIKPPQVATLTEMQDEINRFLFEQKMQEAMVSWLDKLKDEAYIEIRGDYASS